MDTGTIVVLAVIAALILIAVFVAIPRMRQASADRRAEQESRERERELERARQERAEQHRSEADVRMKQAELAEQEARKARAEAEINAKRAELHEQGLADEELGVGNGRRDDSVRTVEGGRAHEPVGADDRTRLEGDAPVAGRRETSDEFERGFEEGREAEAGRGERRFIRTETRDTVDDPEHRPTR